MSISICRIEKSLAALVEFSTTILTLVIGTLILPLPKTWDGDFVILSGHREKSDEQELDEADRHQQLSPRALR